jgi:hypothetical protein
LIDNIQLNKNCTKITETNLAITKSPSFELDRIIDNKKSWVIGDNKHRQYNIFNQFNEQPIRNTNYDIQDERQILNTKEIDLDINISSGVENDVWCFIKDNPNLLTGTTLTTSTCIKDVFDGTICSPKIYCCSTNCGDSGVDLNALLLQSLSSVTTIEDFKYYLISELINVKSRQTIQSYPTLRLLYDRYVNSNEFVNNNSSKFNYFSMDDFANLIGNYWVDIIEQVIPATTMWGATRIYTNTIFDQQKHKYKEYSLLFGNPKYTDILSPATGATCNVEIETVLLSTGTTLNTPQKYTQAYIKQMNSGSEFVGTINTSKSNTIGGFITECTLKTSLGVTNATIGNSNGTAKINSHGAFGALDYKWRSENIIIGTNSNIINNLSAGTYTITVTDTSIEGCYQLTEFKIIEL